MDRLSKLMTLNSLEGPGQGLTLYLVSAFCKCLNNSRSSCVATTPFLLQADLASSINVRIVDVVESISDKIRTAISTSDYVRTDSSIFIEVMCQLVVLFNIHDCAWFTC